MRRRSALALLLLLLVIGSTAVVVGLGEAEQEPAPRTAQSTDRPARTPRRRVRVGADAAGAARPLPTAESGAESGRGTGAETVESDTVPAGAAPPPGPTAVRRVGGHVTDAGSGEVLADARVLVTVLRGNEFVRWWGTRTDAEGRFEQDLDEDWQVADGLRIELRIAKRGYVNTTAPLGDGPLEIQLVERDRPPVPGRVVGTATDTQGRPITGKLLVSAQDEMLDGFSQWVIADAGGGFVLEGVSPGNWLFHAVPGGDGARAIVPDGGETRVHLRRAARTWPAPMTEEEFERRHALLRFDGERRTDETVAGGERDEMARVYALQTLETEWRALRPTREVIVSGVPDEPGAHVRAAVHHGPQHIWRARADEGVARFPALSLEEWRIVVVRPGHPEVERRVDVVAGEGPLRIDVTCAGER